MPFYALLTSRILLPLGIAWYFAMAISEKNFGLIRFKRGPFHSSAAARLRADYLS